MDGQPMLQSTATSTNNTFEEVSVGCVMHRYKGYKAKRRWGQLRIEAENKTARCIIRLYKHDVLNVHQEINKSKEPKLKYELDFSNEDFCGMEKGEHFDKHGQRRYLCIITKDKHLIIEDAVVTATGINHNILGMWFQLLTQVMKYANRRKLVENNPKLAVKICYLHVSMENVSECHSLEDRTRENRNCLVLRMWRTRELTDIKEREITVDGGKTCTDISFNVTDNSGFTQAVNMTVEGTPYLRQTIQQLKRANGELTTAKATRTVCPAFDDLNFHPNLMPKQKSTGKGLKKFLPRTLSSNSSKDDTLDVQQVKKSTRPGQGNCYVRLNSDEPKHAPPSYCNVSLPPEQNDIAPSTSSPGDSLDRRAAPGFHDAGARVQVPPSLLNQTAARKYDAGQIVPLPRPNLSSSNRDPLHRPDLSSINREPSVSPPRLPSPGFGDDDLKKAPGLATQTSFDSGIQTWDIFTESSIGSNPYVNRPLRLNGEPEFPLNEPLARNQASVENRVYQNMFSEQPPALPARDEPSPYQNHQGSYMNFESVSSASNLSVVSKAPPLPPKDSSSQIATSSLTSNANESNENSRPPIPHRSASIDDELLRSRVDRITTSILQGTLPPLLPPEEQQPAYENSYEFELSINEVLQGTHLSDVSGRWLDLPHSVFIKIALGLEKEGVTVGDWKALAEKLGLTFHDIQQLSSLMRVHSVLRPLAVLLLHWSRTQSPFLYTRDNLKELLESIGRDDLAIMIPSDPNS